MAKTKQTPNPNPAPEQAPAAAQALVSPAPKAKAARKAKAAPAPAPAPAPSAAERKARIQQEAAQARHAAHGVIKELVAAEIARRRCLCGCGAEVPRAFFVPGHDAKLLSALLKGDTSAVAA